MKIVLIGYGKMGKEIEKSALLRNHEIVAIIDQPSDWQKMEKEIGRADVAIEFSIPSVVIENIYICFERNIPVVVGTTGWYEQVDKIKADCIQTQNSLFFASNYSIGVNIFFEINMYLAKLMSSQLAYHVSVEETHHIHKLDAPSGTAITLAEGIISNHSQKEYWELAAKPSSSQVLPVQAIREGEVPGTHSIIYDSEVDTITITHEAKSRQGFALGAVLAAEYLKGKTGVFGMKDLLKLNV